MSITREVWTCPDCEVTEPLDVLGPGYVGEARRRAQLGHAERHSAERKRAQPIAGALLDALELVESFRVRIVVAPDDLERVRAQVVRRSLPVDVYASAVVQPGHGYVMQPRRGVRELSLSTPVHNPGDSGDGAVTPR